MVGLSRRQVLTLLSQASCSLYAAPLVLGGCSGLARWLNEPSSLLTPSEMSPIDRGLSDGPEQSAFFGDNPSKAHSLLWNKASSIQERGGLPPPSEYRPVVVVGGGISGLTSAYLLKDRNPLVLEQAPRMGGNSKGQSWRGIEYSIGAAYFCVPEQDSRTSQLFTELGIASLYRQTDGESLIAVNGTLLHDFWSGKGLSKPEAVQVRQLARYLRGIFEEKDSPYPDPSLPRSAGRKSFETLDSTTLRAHLEAVVGRLHPTLAAVIEQYCWSSFVASSTELSAASGINFLAAEFGPIGVFPGGNATVAQALFERLHDQLPSHSLRTSATVIDVRVLDDRAIVSYVDARGSISSVETSSVIMACPKFIAMKLLDDLEPLRVSAISELEYRAYVVANVLLKGDSAINAYDLYLAGENEARGINPREESSLRGATDVVLATYARACAGHSVLTLYRAYPFSGGRAQLLQQNSYETLKERFVEQIHQEVLPLYGFTPNSVVDLRLARWGHPIAVAKPGLVAKGTSDTLRAPFRNRIFFVEQDTWPLPAIETALGEAFYWSDSVRQQTEHPLNTKKTA